MKTVRKYYMQYHVSIPCRPNENHAEGSIQRNEDEMVPHYAQEQSYGEVVVLLTGMDQ